ncbi:hypothetical protein GGQ97_002678 [Sphingomonas kaistensis]|uniref:Bacterial dipeptidyl-peptidase SH3 domain-containing protein n=1 Tax=Sphingomonas kaistensis TaxID=298708 RepID=A0A7X5Y8P4_9SPHN|nr:SH3 domain-containing protein [Sphingomonas kaistensis]NJC06885.1 hypothetical protein [Sphingomonas kaistensis]
MIPTGGRPSGSSPTPIAEAPAGGFPLAGPSTHPDPRTHAYRQDLADIALAGTVIASHYAEPLQCHVARAAALKAGPSAESETLAELEPGASIRILDRSRGWVWGYAGGLVGYVSAAAVGA